MAETIGWYCVTHSTFLTTLNDLKTHVNVDSHGTHTIAHSTQLTNPI